jgi:glycosyltransferase involved in cell wall biosynthesis
MEILLVTGIYPPDLGGPATYIPHLERYLERNKIEFKTVTLTNGPTTKISKIVKVSREHNKFLRVMLTILQIRKAAKSSDCILANGLFEEVAFATFWMKKRIVMKVVGDPIWERFRNRTGSSTGIDDFQTMKKTSYFYFQRKVLTWSLNRADEVTTPSEHLKEVIKNWGVKKPLTVIQNGTPCRDAEPSEKMFDVILVSRLVSWKNIDSVLRGLRNTDFHVGIVGSGPELWKLRGLASASQNKISFLGELDEESVVQALSQSSIYVLNSDYEGLSFALINAMMLGKSIIVSDIKGNTQVVDDGVEGIVISGRDEAQILNAVNSLIDNPDWARSLGQKARSKALETFCLEKRLTEMRNLLERRD